MGLNEVEEINRNFYMGALHLFEAGKYLSNVDADFANGLLSQAQEILKAIKIQEQKLEDDEMQDILGKIMDFDLNKHEKLKEIETGLSVDNG